MEVLARAITQEKEIRSIQIIKEEVKSFLFVDKILYVENLKDSAKRNKQTEIITVRDNKFQQIVGDKVNTKKSVVLLYINNEQFKRKIMEQFT